MRTAALLIVFFVSTACYSQLTKFVTQIKDYEGENLDSSSVVLLVPVELNWDGISEIPQEAFYMSSEGNGIFGITGIDDGNYDVFINTGQGHQKNNNYSGIWIGSGRITKTADAFDEEFALKSTSLKSNSIPGSKLQDNSLSGIKLLDNSISSDKLAGYSVTTAKVQDDAITPGKLSHGSAGQILIESGSGPVYKSVSGDITINASGISQIGTAKIIESTIADNAVTPAKIADNSIPVSKINHVLLESSTYSAEADTFIIEYGKTFSNPEVILTNLYPWQAYLKSVYTDRAVIGIAPSGIGDSVKVNLFVIEK